MQSDGMSWYGSYDSYGWGGGYDFSSAWKDLQREVTQMEHQRVELISKRNLRNHLRASQQRPAPIAKIVPVRTRPVARNNTRS